MKQAVTESQSQEQHISQLHWQRDDTVNSSGAHFLRHPSANNWTGCRGISTITGISGGDYLRKAKVQLCLHNFRGTCAHGASCKYHHADIGEQNRSRFYQNERRSLGVVADLGNSQLHTENKVIDSRTRFANAGYKGRSSCHKFQSGRCYRGASCPYLHPQLVRYDTPTCSASIEQQQAHGAVRVSGFGEEDRNIASRISQGQDAANKKNNMRTRALSIGQRSRSLCRNFLSGKCVYGSNCRRLHPINTFDRSRSDFSYQHRQRLAKTSSNSACSQAHRDATSSTSQGHNESNMHNPLRTGAFTRKFRSKSPCRKFFHGKCYRGESCPHWHASPVHDRTRHDGSMHSISWVIQNHEDQENRRIQPSWGMQTFYGENQARSTKDGMQLAGNRGNIDVTSKSWSSKRHRSGNASDCSGNKLIREPEVCLQFTKGKCNHGDSCSYLHGYHKYATSNWNTRLTEVDVDSRNSGAANQHASTVMGQQYDGLKKAVVDQKGDASVMDGQKCELPEENSAGLCNFAEGHQESSLWSLPFKKRRRQSISPLTPRNDNSCMNLRRYDSRMDLRRERCYNASQSHFPDRRSYTFERPTYHANCHQSSIGAGTSRNMRYREKFDSKPVGLQRHEDIVNQGSQIARASRNDETDFASLALPPLQFYHIDQNDKKLGRDIITVDRSLGVAAGSQRELKSDPASSCKVQFVSPEAFSSSMLDKEGNVEDTNENTADLKPSLKTYFRKKFRKSVQGSVSCEEFTKEGASNTLKQQENGSIIEYIKQTVECAPAMAEVSRRKLLVLDVNGLLVDFVSRFPKCYKPDTTVSGKGVFKRPFCDDFLLFCFEKYDVGIWSSRTEKNLTRVVNFLMKDTHSRLLFCWDQSHCTPTGYSTVENREKPLVLKELKNLWDNKGGSLPWKKGYYNETNTILLDDSPYKALRNPPYTAIFPHPYTFKNVEDKSLGPGGDLRVHLERLAEAENVQKFIQENPFGQRPITKANLSWAFYAKIVGMSEGNLLEEKAKVGGSDGIQLEEKTNIVATSDGSQLEEKDGIVGTLNEAC